MSENIDFLVAVEVCNLESYASNRDKVIITYILWYINKKVEKYTRCGIINVEVVICMMQYTHRLM